MSIGYKEALLNKMRSISEATADEVYNRVENMPAKELVGLLTSSIQLQTILESEIREAKIRMEETSEDKVVEVKYQNLGVNRNKVINLLDNLG